MSKKKQTNNFISDLDDLLSVHILNHGLPTSVKVKDFIKAHILVIKAIYSMYGGEYMAGKITREKAFKKSANAELVLAKGVGTSSNIVKQIFSIADSFNTLTSKKKVNKKAKK